MCGSCEVAEQTNLLLRISDVPAENPSAGTGASPAAALEQAATSNNMNNPGNVPDWHLLQAQTQSAAQILWKIQECTPGAGIAAFLRRLGWKARLLCGK